jgi:hypothetical protein
MLYAVCIAAVAGVPVDLSIYLSIYLSIIYMLYAVCIAAVAGVPVERGKDLLDTQSADRQVNFCCFFFKTKRSCGRWGSGGVSKRPAGHTICRA